MPKQRKTTDGVLECKEEEESHSPFVRVSDTHRREGFVLASQWMSSNLIIRFYNAKPESFKDVSCEVNQSELHELKGAVFRAGDAVFFD